MDYEELKKNYILYLDNQLHWIPFTKMLGDFQENYSDEFINFMKKMDLKMVKANELLRSYDYLKIKFPKKLNDKMKGSPSAIAYLPTFRMKMIKKGHSKEEIEKIILKVIDGEKGYGQTSLSRACASSATMKKLEERFLTSEGKSYDAFAHALRLLNILSDGILEKKELIEIVRKAHGIECHEVGRKLEAIFSEDFYKTLNKKTEIYLEI